MKIIIVDNFNRDDVSEQLAAENVCEMYAKTMTEALNQKYSGSTSPLFFQAVPNNHELYTWEP